MLTRVRTRLSLMMKTDLHTHSYYSDGVLSPSELVKLAKSEACEVLALSDHDTTAGLDEAQQQADKLYLKLIASVEISAQWQGQTVHIVGLGIDKENTTLQAGLKQHQVLRQVRARKMGLGLEQAGIKNAYQKAKALAPYMLTRTHFAQMLIQEDICCDMNTVFKYYLSGNKPGAAPASWANLAAVVGWILVAGGVAVLAHPFRYGFTPSVMTQLLADFKDCGGGALEVVLSHSTDQEIRKGTKLAKRYNLLASLGSDYHGWSNQRQQLGRLKSTPANLGFVLDVFL